MKRAIMVHGWEGKPDEGWMPWLKLELEKTGWEVSAPYMPNPAMPKLHDWLEVLGQEIGSPNEGTYLIGHSLGCFTILKYLESLPAESKIGGVVLVAGFAGNLKHPIPVLRSYYQEGLQWDKVKPHSDNFTAIYSKRDDYVREESAYEFAAHLGAKVVENSKWVHFSGIEGIKELPEALQALLEMSR